MKQIPVLGPIRIAQILAKGIRPELARLTLARKIAAVTLTLWKRGEGFDELKVSDQAA